MSKKEDELRKICNERDTWQSKARDALERALTAEKQVRSKDGDGHNNRGNTEALEEKLRCASCQKCHHRRVPVYVRACVHAMR